MHRTSSVESARGHIRQIVTEFGTMPLSALRPSLIKMWIARLQAAGLSASYIHALHRRLSQIMSDAVHDGLLGRNPCSRRTSPPMGKQKLYVATTEQVWQIHDAMPEHLRSAILLGAFAGLRIGEVCGLRVSDVDFLRGVVHPAQQWARGDGFGPLKTECSAAQIPVPRDLTLLLSASVQRYGGEMLVSNCWGKPCRPAVIRTALREVCNTVDGLPDGFSFHDLRHYFASLSIASGTDIKTVQARLRHANATITLDTYGHLFPDADESTRAAVAAAITQRMPADDLRTI